MSFILYVLGSLRGKAGFKLFVKTDKNGRARSRLPTGVVISQELSQQESHLADDKSSEEKKEYSFQNKQRAPRESSSIARGHIECLRCNNPARGPLPS